jgi:hypothetical protein
MAYFYTYRSPPRCRRPSYLVLLTNNFSQVSDTRVPIQTYGPLHACWGSSSWTRDDSSGPNESRKSDSRSSGWYLRQAKLRLSIRVQSQTESGTTHAPREDRVRSGSPYVSRTSISEADRGWRRRHAYLADAARTDGLGCMRAEPRV